MQRTTLPTIEHVRQAIFRRVEDRQWTHERGNRAYKITLPLCERHGHPCEFRDGDDSPVCIECYIEASEC